MNKKSWWYGYQEKKKTMTTTTNNDLSCRHRRTNIIVASNRTVRTASQPQTRGIPRIVIRIAIVITVVT